VLVVAELGLLWSLLTKVPLLDEETLLNGCFSLRLPPSVSLLVSPGIVVDRAIEFWKGGHRKSRVVREVRWELEAVSELFLHQTLNSKGRCDGG